MRYLGIDYGAKRVGVAVSDDRGDFSYPLTVLDNPKNLILEIKKICEENNIGEIVVGESRDFSQKENDIMSEIKPFVKSLEENLGLPVHMHPEFMTSQEAERLQGKNLMHDASAAALILKHFLDSKIRNT
ncbi:MAG TPA: Holliday junction resolvase RuvX [Candidatus Paceibacterota bacterium]